jgi:hypothetical protein
LFIWFDVIDLWANPNTNWQNGAYLTGQSLSFKVQEEENQEEALLCNVDDHPCLL